MHATPARRDDQRPATARFVIGGLVLVALAVAAVLFVVISRGEEATDLPVTTIVPTAAPVSGAAAPAPTVQAAPPGGPPGIAGARAWDPYGDNGTENDAHAARAIDGDPDTSWATECYQDRYLGAKGGVGLVVDLTEPGSGTLTAQVASAPYQLSVYVTDAVEAPADPQQWTPVGETAHSEQAGTVERQIDVAASHVLLWFTELGADDACTSSNPHRGLLAEVAFTE